MIYCVEDDGAIRDIEVYALRSAGFQAEGLEDSGAFWKAAAQQPPELVVLDVMLPGMDGVEMLEKLRADPALSRVPVIMATAKGAEFDKVHSLDLGADDYIVKPFGVMELISRVRAVLRRCQSGGPADELVMGGVVLRLSQRTVTVDGRRAALTYKEFELLRLFMSHPGTAFTRDQLFQQVWGSDFAGETRTLDVHIRSLRQKLGQYGPLIETVRHVGYRMEAKA